MTNYHEPPSELTSQTRDYVRALNSLKEEIEAVDWYQQRIDAAGDEQLKSILAHNRDEEMEHACMMIEWLRRNQSGWNDELKTYLFTEGDITRLEEAEEGDNGEEADTSEPNLGIGSLK